MPEPELAPPAVPAAPTAPAVALVRAQAAPGGRPALLEVADLEVRYGQVRALESVALRVRAGSFTALLGPNGAGKTTLMRAVSGLVRSRRGSITFDGQRIDGRSPWKIAKMGIGHVHEGRRIFPEHTVLENLQIGGYPIRRRPGAFAAALDGVFDLFPRLAQRRDQAAGTLSGGEAQMLAVARALVAGPRLLMLDEPSLGLAPQVIREMFDHLRTIHRQTGVTILLVEQAAAVALQLADEAYVLSNGHMLRHGPAEEIRTSEEIAKVYFGA